MLDISLPSDVTAPEQVRRSLDEMERELQGEVFDDLQLLVTELVTNSVKFAGEGPIAVKLVASDQVIRVEVHDDGPGFEPPQGKPSLTDTDGRGLFLVESIADRWGIDANGSTCVWFELDTGRDS